MLSLANLSHPDVQQHTSHTSVVPVPAHVPGSILCRWASVAVPLVANLQYQERQAWGSAWTLHRYLGPLPFLQNDASDPASSTRAPTLSSCFPPWQSVAQRGRYQRSTPLRIASRPSREPCAHALTPRCRVPSPPGGSFPQCQGVALSKYTVETVAMLGAGLRVTVDVFLPTVLDCHMLSPSPEQPQRRTGVRSGLGAETPAEACMDVGGVGVGAGEGAPLVRLTGW